MGVALLLQAIEATAYVDCSGVPVDGVESAEEAWFHNFNELGVTGGTVFVQVDPSRCRNSEGGAFGEQVFMVIDEMDAGNDQGQIWLSMLLSAQASGRTIKFHARSLGVNDRGFQALEPYYLRVD